MCGIAGILGLSAEAGPRKGELRAMAAQLRHRGPDGEGFWAGGPVGLAHRRLSIIDLRSGAQPIHNEDSSVWVVFNGEIFNYVELRRDLVHRGHHFYTQSDTEVLVHLYEEHGTRFLDHLNGQFAVALWDDRNRRLVLARDRAGILPLFYAVKGGRLLFGSEVKALLPVLGRPALDPVALDQMMTFWAPLSPRTLFEGVLELPPGHMLEVHDGQVSERPYWDWTFPSAPDEYTKGSPADLAEELRDLLVDATRIRLRADVPVGAYLSGGLDSSVLVSVIRRHTDTELHTFSIGFESGALDESRFQRMLVDHLDTEHDSIRCTERDVARNFIDTIRHTETAIPRTAPTPMKLLSGLVHARGYKVVLTGEGSDEVLGGYDLFQEAKVRRFWARHPDSAWRPLLLKRLYPDLNLSAGNSAHFLKGFFARGLGDTDSPLFAHQPRWHTTSRAKAFFSPALAGHVHEAPIDAIQASLPAGIMGWHPFNQGQYLEAKSLMGSYLLSSQGDRMLMANSVEGRFPFLDHRVIEFANRLDPRLKMKVLNEKYLLKKAMEGYVPAPILRRHKQAYRAPDAASFVSCGRLAQPWAEELLSESTVRAFGYFDPKKVRLLVRKACSGSMKGVGDNQALVGILSTQIWHHLFVDRYSADFGHARLPESPTACPS
jgi:asparagine synthase (glutamine-hydrolysing)